MRHIRRCPRSRAAAEPCADEDHSCAGQRLADLLCRFESGLIAKLRVATCTQPTGDSATELHFVRGNGARQRLYIGVGRQDLCSLQSVEHDSIERIQTGATNTDNFDWNKFLRPLGEAVIFAELNHIDLSASGPAFTVPNLSLRAKRGTSQFAKRSHEVLMASSLICADVNETK